MMSRVSESIIVLSISFMTICMGVAALMRSAAQREAVMMQRDDARRGEDACYAQGQLARTRTDTLAAIRYCGEIGQVSPFRPLVIRKP